MERRRNRQQRNRQQRNRQQRNKRRRDRQRRDRRRRNKRSNHKLSYIKTTIQNSVWRHPPYTTVVYRHSDNDYVLQCNNCNSRSGSLWVIDHNYGCPYWNLSICSLTKHRYDRIKGIFISPPNYRYDFINGII